MKRKLLWPVCLGITGWLFSHMYTYGAPETYAYDLRVQIVYTVGGVIAGFVVATIIARFSDKQNKARPLQNGVREIPPRPLTQREVSWVQDILQVNPDWRGTDVSQTRVVAEGPVDEGVCFILNADEPENPKAASLRETVGNLWIQTGDGSTINIQLSHVAGRLHEIYVLFIDTKRPNRPLPESWVEVSRAAADM